LERRLALDLLRAEQVLPDPELEAEATDIDTVAELETLPSVCRRTWPPASEGEAEVEERDAAEAEAVEEADATEAEEAETVTAAAVKVEEAAPEAESVEEAVTAMLEMLVVEPVATIDAPVTVSTTPAEL
jgi:hypothetical protein